MRTRTVVITPSRDLSLLKAKARRLKRELKMPHMQALDRVAVEAGYRHWGHVIRCAEQTAPAEQAFRSGLVVAFDAKEGMDAAQGAGAFVEDPILQFFCEPSLRPVFADTEEPDEDNRCFRDIYPPEELDTVIRECLEDLRFARWDGMPVPGAWQEVASFLRATCFWAPLYMWLRGELRSPADGLS